MSSVNKIQIEKRLLTTVEAACYLGVSEHWLKTSRFRPELDGPPFIKMNRAVRYDIHDLNAWLDAHRFRGTHEIFSVPNMKGA